MFTFFTFLLFFKQRFILFIKTHYLIFYKFYFNFIIQNFFFSFTGKKNFDTITFHKYRPMFFYSMYTSKFHVLNFISSFLLLAQTVDDQIYLYKIFFFFFTGINLFLKFLFIYLQYCCYLHCIYPRLLMAAQH